MKKICSQFILASAVLILAVACSRSAGEVEDVSSPTSRSEPQPTAVEAPADGPAPTSQTTTAEAQADDPTPTSPPTLVAAQPGAIGLGDPFFPDEGNGGYDVQHYDIELTADMEAQQIDAVVTIAATAVADLSAFNLDFKQFKITELLVNDENTHFLHEEDELTITPVDPLPAGQPFTVQVAYNGHPQSSLDLGDGIPTGWLWGEGGATVVSEPFGAQTWYPVNDSPLDKATYTFRITVPDPLVVAANGLPGETIGVGDLTTYVWEASDPMASYLATVTIGDLTVQVEETEDGLPLINYFPPARAEEMHQTFSPTAAMIAYFSDAFGPYPFESFGAVVLDVPAGFALETQTRPIYARNFAREPVIVHELAHQWFGNSVSLETWQDMWLKEGMATYAEWLWQEQTNGREALDQMFARSYAAMKAASQSASYLPPGQPDKDELYTKSVYEGGAATLHALRLQVGDEAFFEILQTYANRYRDANASTADFIAVAEEVSGQDLADFFNTWLYSSDLPALALD